MYALSDELITVIDNLLRVQWSKYRHVPGPEGIAKSPVYYTVVVAYIYMYM